MPRSSRNLTGVIWIGSIPASQKKDDAMIWNLTWIWVGLASLLTVVSVWRHMVPKWLGAPAATEK